MTRIFLYATSTHAAPEQALCAALGELARRLDRLDRDHTWVSVTSHTHSLTPTTTTGRGRGGGVPGWLAAATVAVETAALSTTARPSTDRKDPP